MEYLITKREKCEACDGKGYRLVNEDPLGIGLPCSCATGYIETPVDLLEALKRLQQPDYIDGQLIGYDSLLSDKAYFRED